MTGLLLSIVATFALTTTILQVSHGLPLPTRPQLNWQQNEIMALVHFNMATFFQDGATGCNAANWNGNPASRDPSSFAPTNLNISNWVDSMRAVGAHEAVLTAKHGCGFYLWPTAVTFDDGTPYGYTVPHSMNILRMFVDTMKDAGMGAGFYYTFTFNFYLNVFNQYVQNTTLIPGQRNVTQAEYERISLASVHELWSQFGDLNEIWFDGGYLGEMKTELSQMLKSLQPNALCLNGGGISQNPARWSETEGELPPGWPDIFSTACCDTCSGPGCPPNATDAFYYPSSTDYTLQANDVWFYEPGAPLRTLAEMQSTYHLTVGANTVMELAFSIDRTGNVHPDHAKLYAEFGSWIRDCYQFPLAKIALPRGEKSVVLLLAGGDAVVMDRIVLQEDQSVEGQCVFGYTLETRTVHGWTLFSSAKTVGNKRIALGESINASAVRFNLTGQFCVPTLNISVFGPERCVTQTPRTVQFRYHGRCLTTNKMYRCGPGDSCPLFLGDCGGSESLWDDSMGYLSNIGDVFLNNAVNIDCNSCQPHSLAKVYRGLQFASPIMFTQGQLVYKCGNSSMCLNGGQGPARVPCSPNEPFLDDQIQIDSCSFRTTHGWTRVVVA